MASYNLTHRELEELWVLAGGPQQYADTAAAIAQAESGGCQYALAGPRDIRPVKACTWRITKLENSCGFWQVNLRAHHDYSAPLIFRQLENAAAAVAISSFGTNFGPWSTYTNGAYKAHLTGGGTPAPQPGPVDVTPGSVTAPHAHQGWADLRQSVTHHLPNQLARSDQVAARALKLLSHRSRLHGAKR